MDGLPSLAGSINGGKLKLLAVGSAQRLPNRPGNADHRRDAAGDPARARLLRADGAARHARSRSPAKISEDLRAVLSEPATKQRFEDIASYINPMSPGASCVSYIRTEQALWKPVIEQISTFKAVPK